MSSKRKILIQLDVDRQPSTFDRVVAIDSGVDELFSYGGVTEGDIDGLVHGAMFTRGPADLSRTALFVGGSDVAAGEALLRRIVRTFFGPLRCSVLLDASGANTTAAAAVIAAGRHLDLSGTTAVVLGGTGPVGQRVAYLLARAGTTVALASRSLDRARSACNAIKTKGVSGNLAPVVWRGDITASDLPTEAVNANLVIAAGAAGTTLLTRSTRLALQHLKVMIDLNAVPPLGLEGIDVSDKGATRDGVTTYGALGVGGTKMKIHRKAVETLFEANTYVLDAPEIFDLGLKLETST